jgi:hypothetical protein
MSVPCARTTASRPPISLILLPRTKSGADGAKCSTNPRKARPSRKAPRCSAKPARLTKRWRNECWLASRHHHPSARALAWAQLGAAATPASAPAPLRATSPPRALSARILSKKMKNRSFSASAEVSMARASGLCPHRPPLGMRLGARRTLATKEIVDNSLRRWLHAKRSVCGCSRLLYSSPSLRTSLRQPQLISLCSAFHPHLRRSRRSPCPPSQPRQAGLPLTCPLCQRRRTRRHLTTCHGPALHFWRPRPRRLGVVPYSWEFSQPCPTLLCKTSSSNSLQWPRIHTFQNSACGRSLASLHSPRSICARLLHRPPLPHPSTLPAPLRRCTLRPVDEVAAARCFLPRRLLRLCSYSRHRRHSPLAHRLR